MEGQVTAETAEVGLLLNNSESDGKSGFIVEGYLYEIDHKQLPPKSPNSIKSIRTVMVTEKTDVNVSVKFPSISSLRKYFGKESSGRNKQGAKSGQVFPVLDEQFIMGTKLARKVLWRLVPSEEWESHMHLESFWLVSDEAKPKVIGYRSIIVKEELSENEIPSEKRCLSLAETGGLGSWGVRRKVRYIGKHTEQPSSFEGTGANQTAKKVCKRSLENSGEGAERKVSKRQKLFKTMKRPTDMHGRWSAERYKAAQLKLFDIMRAKHAVYGNPILRPVLRSEARKHIGDTGLLDHLLKHMTNTVVSNDGERFRRHHNAQGAMEYWLEPAGLMELRKSAGVKNPYWGLPSGWRPGDDLSQLAMSSEEVKLLKEDVAMIKRELENLCAAKVAATSEKQETEALEMSLQGNGEPEADPISYSQEIYTGLLKRKGQLEQQMIEVSNSLRQMQKDIHQYTEKVEASKVEKKMEKDRTLRSGFRMCKPEGTFLWPHAGHRGHSNIPVEEILVPAPPLPSSSATSAAPLKPVVKNTTTFLPTVSGVTGEPGGEGNGKLTRSDSTASIGNTWPACSLVQLENLRHLRVQPVERTMWAPECSPSPGTAGGSITDSTLQASSPSSWIALASPSSSAFVTRGY